MGSVMFRSPARTTLVLVLASLLKDELFGRSVDIGSSLPDDDDELGDETSGEGVTVLKLEDEGLLGKLGVSVEEFVKVALSVSEEVGEEVIVLELDAEGLLDTVGVSVE